MPAWMQGEVFSVKSGFWYTEKREGLEKSEEFSNLKPISGDWPQTPL